uniref:Laminin subunit gamma-1 n=1 Tax=Aceria tosichella TaxID=561515 RepID=A0A6G1SF50_9ACAR
MQRRNISSSRLFIMSLLASTLIVFLLLLTGHQSNNILAESYQITTNCDCNPAGSNSSECNRVTGQCDCKNTNIVGLKCDKCRENYHNLASGCVECDTCYQIVQLGVEHHRRELDELTDMINKLENNPEISNEKNFAKQLLDLMTRVNDLLGQAEHAQGIESSLLSQFEILLARVKKVKGITDGIDKYLKSTKPVLKEAGGNITIAEELLRRIQEEGLKAEKYLMTEGMTALDRARERADKMGKQSQKMSEWAKESRQLADQHEADAAKIKEHTLAAMNFTLIAYELAKDAAIAQEANAKNIARLRQKIENLVELLAKTKKMTAEATNEAKKSYDEALALYTLINSLQINKADIPKLKQQAADHLKNAQKLRTEVEEFITRHAQLLDSTQFKLNEMKALLAEAIRQQSITDAQLADIDKTIQKAKDAVKQGDKTLKEAQDTLATLLKFDQKVQESQKEAMEALKKIPGIRKMIKQAEDKTKDAANKLDSALADATDARDIAQQAFGLANETSVDIRKIRLEAGELKSRISTLKTQASELGDNINHTSAAMDQFEGVARTDGELAQQALNRANQAAMSARNATETAKNLLNLLNPLLKSIDKIEGIDGNKLGQLEDELAKLKQKFAESNLAAITDDLLAQRDKQRELMKEYQALIDWLIKEVANIKAIRDSLPDKCFKRVRLEVPMHEN